MCRRTPHWLRFNHWENEPLALQHWLQLSLTSGIGPILTQRLVQAAGSAEKACRADATVLQSIEGIGAGKASSIANALRKAEGEAEAELRRAASVNVTIVCPDDDSYPLLLRDIPDPPSVLYVRGTLEPRDLNALAIVGSRKCTFYGREQAERFAALLAGAGMTVVSGGARGVDSATHRGALSHPNGRTIAVLGSGVDVAYPPENIELFNTISKRGAVVSEYPLGTEPARENFPRRNRIISGMSRGVLIVEADERSGALITARQAYDDQGRPVFALPGRIDNPLSVGPHRLIRDGATLTTNLEDILDGLGPLPQSARELMPQNADEIPTSSPENPQPAFTFSSPAGLTAQQELLLERMGTDELSVDQIIELTGLQAGEVLQELTLLTLKGLIRRTGGQVFVRRKN
jgi:DNA processing protein